MLRRLVRGVCFVALVLAILTTPIFGQAFYGSIVGTVTDQSSSAVRGATVTLTNVGTDERHQTQTGGEGGYQIHTSVSHASGSTSFQ